MMRRRQRSESRVVFPWETRSALLDWLTSRRRRTLVTLGLGALAVTGLLRVETHRRQVLATRAAIVSVRNAVAAFRADHGRCPHDIAELVHPPTDGDNPARYLVDPRLDGWGRPLRITCPGRNHPLSADVESGGSSGTFDDLERIY
ncbi:MAG: type II secretion system protein GspG [Myxococcales bacterium]|nr:type II secretion system protein GspG [Myxococcales bacterium]